MDKIGKQEIKKIDKAIWDGCPRYIAVIINSEGTPQLYEKLRLRETRKIE